MSYTGNFALWLFARLERGRQVCGNGWQRHPKHPASAQESLFVKNSIVHSIFANNVLISNHHSNPKVLFTTTTTYIITPTIIVSTQCSTMIQTQTTNHLTNQNIAKERKQNMSHQILPLTFTPQNPAISTHHHQPT